MKALGILTWIAISRILTALIQAVALRQLWSWLVAADYGAGPSLAGWFGIATIIGLLVESPRVTRDTSKESPKESWDEVARRSVSITLGKWLVIGFVMLITWWAGAALGWVR